MTIEEAKAALKAAEIKRAVAYNDYLDAIGAEDRAKTALNEAIAHFKVGNIVTYRGKRMTVKGFTRDGAIYAPFKKDGTESLKTIEERRYSWTDNLFTAVKEEN